MENQDKNTSVTSTVFTPTQTGERGVYTGTQKPVVYPQTVSQPAVTAYEPPVVPEENSLETPTQNIPTPSVVAPLAPPIKKSPFNRAFLAIAATAVIIVLTVVGVAGYISRKNTSQLQAPSESVNEQGITLGNATPDVLSVLQLKGSDSKLIVNGDVITTGRISIASGDFYGQFVVNNLTANREYTFPNSDGTVCLDSNNCNFATDGNFVSSIGGTAGALTIGAGLSLNGTTIINSQTQSTLNGFSGAVTLQGTNNQIIVSNSGNVVTLSTPQDIANTSSPTFAGVTLTSLTVTGSSTSINGIAYTWPGSQLNGVLVNDGSGGLTWSAIAAACPTCFVNGGNSFGGNATLGTNDGFSLAFETGGTSRMFIDTTGNVGIGTTSAGQRLYVPWLAGDTTPTSSFGSANAGNNQIAVIASSNTNAGLTASSVTDWGVVGQTTGDGTGGVNGIGSGGVVGIATSATNSYGILGLGTLFGGASNNIGVGAFGSSYGLYASSTNSSAIFAKGGCAGLFGCVPSTAPITVLEQYDNSTTNDFLITRNPLGSIGFRVASTGHLGIGNGNNAAVNDCTLFAALLAGATCSDIINVQESVTDFSKTYTTGISNQILLSPAAGASVTSTIHGIGNSVVTTANSANYSIVRGDSSNVIHQGSGTISFGEGGHFSVNNLSNGSITFAKGFAADAINTSSGTIGGATGINANVANVAGGTITTATGLGAAAINLGAGSITTAYGIDVTTGSSGAGSITTNYGIRIQSALSAGTITNNYGLYIQDQSGEGSSNSYNLYSAGTGTNYFGGNIVAATLGAADTATYLCRNSSNQIATCNSSGVGVAFVQGGNSFGATATLGTNDAFDLNIETNNITRLTVTSGGDVNVVNDLTVGSQLAAGSVGSITANTIATFAEVYTANSGTLGGTSAIITLNPASASSANATASLNNIAVSGQNHTGFLAGASSSVTNNGSGTLTYAFGNSGGAVNTSNGNIAIGYGTSGAVVNSGAGNFTFLGAGVVGQIQNTGAGNIVSAASLFAASAVNSGAGTITSNSGLYVQAQTAGVSDYGIQVEAADTQTLWLSNNADNTTASAGIAFGSSRDTNLYRSAASTLTSDGNLILTRAADTTLSVISQAGAARDATFILDRSQQNNARSYIRLRTAGVADWNIGTYNCGGGGEDGWDSLQISSAGNDCNSSSTQFTFSKAGNFYVRDGGITVGTASTTTGTLTLQNASGAGSILLTPANPGASSFTITAPAETGTMCLQNSANCGFATGSGSAFVNGGNSFGTTATLGTNEAQNLVFRTNSTTACTISSVNQSLSCPGAGGSSERFGASSAAAGASATALGNGASAAAFNTIAIGQGATAGNNYDIVIGVGTSAGASGENVIIGSGASSTSSISSAVAIGRSATGARASVAIGQGATASSNFDVAIGVSATTGGTGSSSVAIGRLATVTGSDSVGIGHNVQAANIGTIVLGSGAASTAANQFVAGSATAAVTSGYFGNGVTNAAPAAFTLNATGSSTVGTVGAAFTLAGGAGATSSTGSGGGAVNILGGTSGGSGANNGGNVTISGGTKTSTGLGGSVIIKPQTSNDVQTAMQVQNAGGTALMTVNTLTSGLNLVANSSFEQSNNGWSAKGAATITNDDTASNAKFGLRTLKIATTAAANDGASYRFPFAASTSYAVSFWAKLDSGSATTINFGRADNGSDTDCLTGQTVNTTWTQFTCSFTTGATIGSSANFYIKQSDAAARNIFIDGVTLVGGATALTYVAPANNLQVDAFYNNLTLNAQNNGELQQWNANSNAISQRYYHGTVTANGYMYVIGGHDGTDELSTVQYARINNDGSVGAFASTSALPAARSNGGTAYANGYIYYIAGDDSTATSTSTIYYAKVNTDGTLGNWQTNATTWGAARNFTSTAVLNGYIYTFGGSNATSVYMAKLNSDGSVGPSNTTTALPGARSRVATTVANGYIYVIGGDSTATPQSTIYYAKPASDGQISAWSTSANTLPAARTAQGTVAANGYLYTVGGGSSTSVATNNVYYTKLNTDGSMGTWQSATNTLPSVEFRNGVVMANGYIYSVGGASANTTATNFVYYTSLPRVQVGGSLDLVGLDAAGGLSDGSDTGSVGGSLTAGSTRIIGSLDVQGTANFASSVSINKDLAVNGSLTVQGNRIGPSAYLGSMTAIEDIWVQGRYVYTIHNSSTDQLRVVDVGNPMNPVQISAIATNDNPQAIYVAGRYAYVVSTTAQQLQVFDISNPKTPTLVSTTSIGSGLQDIYVQGHYAYIVSSSGSTFYAYDISNPASPVSAGSITTASNQKSVFVSGRYAYITAAGSNDDLYIVDISNPASMSITNGGGTAVGNNPEGVYVQGRYAYVVNNADNTLSILDVSDPTTPTTASTLSLAASNTAFGVYVQDKYAYITSDTASGNRFQVIDVTNPSVPISVASYDHSVYVGGGMQDLIVQGKYAYVTGPSTTARVEVIDLGGAYVQQLEAGGIDTGTFAAQGAITGASDLTVQGAGTFGGGLNVTGPASFGYGSENGVPALQIKSSSTSTTAGTLQAHNIAVSDTGIVTTGTDTTYGQNISVSRTGATGGTINTYGSYVATTSDNAGAGTANTYGIYGSATGGDTTYGVYGIGSTATTSSAYGGNFTANATLVAGTTATLLAGTQSTITAQGLTGSNTVTNAYGFRGVINATSSTAFGGTLTVTNAYGLQIDSANNDYLAAGAATITNNYGVLIKAQTAGTSDYGVAIEASDTQTLWVGSSADSTTAAAGIAFGLSRDTNLYRSAANTLKTDDNFLLQTASNSTTAMRIMDSSSNVLFNADTSTQGKFSFTTIDGGSSQLATVTISNNDATGGNQGAGLIISNAVASGNAIEVQNASDVASFTVNGNGFTDLIAADGHNSTDYILDVQNDDVTGGTQGFGLRVSAGTTTGSNVALFENMAGTDFFRILGDGQALFNSPDSRNQSTAGFIIQNDETTSGQSAGLQVIAGNSDQDEVLQITNRSAEDLLIVNGVGRLQVNTTTGFNQSFAPWHFTNNDTTSGHGDGLLLQAGNSSSDTPLEVQTRTGTSLMSVNGVGATIHQTSTDSTTGFKVMDADGGTSVFNVDTTNERVGIGIDAPTEELDVVGEALVSNKLQVGDAAGAGTINQCFTVIGIGTCDIGLEVYNASTETINSSYGAQSTLVTTAGSASGANNIGFSGILGLTGTQNYTGASNMGVYGGAVAYTAGTVTEIIGVHGEAVSAAGTLTTGVGLQGIVYNSAGTFTNGIGLRIQSATGTIANNYGIQVKAQTAGTADYGVAIEAADTQTLWVGSAADSTTSAAGIAFGSSRDTNLYRSAAATLATGATTLSFTGASGTVSTATTDAALTVQSNGTGALTLDSGTTGNVNLGTNANAKTVTIGNATGATDVNVNLGSGVFNVTNTAADANTVAQFNNAGGTNCTVIPGGTGFACTSDARFKTNVAAIINPLDTIRQLRGVRFNWLSSPDGQTQSGFIAQELAQIIPDAVGTAPDGTLVANYSTIVPYLVGAAQEQDLQITGLQQNQVTLQQGQDASAGGVASLNGRVDTLEQKVSALEAQQGQGGGSDFTNLNVSGTATIQNLTVSGAATIGQLTVTGNATFAGNITIQGHVLGNADTRGTVTVPAGQTQAKVTFTKPYSGGSQPNVILTAKNTFAPSYRVESSETDFTVFFQTAQSTDVILNYQVQE